MADMVAYWKD